jgi:hypothetical protein
MKNHSEYLLFIPNKTMKNITLFLLLSFPCLGQSVTIDPATSTSGIIEAKSTSSGILVAKMTSAQRSAIVSPATGLLVYDTTTNSFWFFNSSTWQKINTDNGVGLWVSSGIYTRNANTGNVGIGINPTKAQFEVSTGNTTQAIFGTNSGGISLQKDHPTIGFNQYRDVANVQRYLSNGYAMGNYFSPANGSMYWSVMPSGTADNPTISETAVMTLSYSGNLGIGTLTPQARLDVAGYAKLGELAPSIKQKSITGTIPCASNNCTDNIAHGLDASKIVDITIVINCPDSDGNLTQFVEPNDCTSLHSGYCYYTSFDNTNIIIRHPGSGTINTLGKPYKILITYKE